MDMKYPYLIGKREVSRDGKWKLLKSAFLPVLLYGSESWIIWGKHASMITAAKMRFLKKA